MQIIKALVLFLPVFSSVASPQSDQASELSVVNRQLTVQENDSIAINNFSTIIQKEKDTYSSAIIRSENSDMQQNKIRLSKNDLNFNRGISRRFISKEKGDVFSSPGQPL